MNWLKLVEEDADKSFLCRPIPPKKVPDQFWTIKYLIANIDQRRLTPSTTKLLRKVLQECCRIVGGAAHSAVQVARWQHIQETAELGFLSSTDGVMIRKLRHYWQRVNVSWATAKSSLPPHTAVPNHVIHMCVNEQTGGGWKTMLI